MTRPITLAIRPWGLTMKKCPFCAEEIQDQAIKCKHCGERFEPEGPGFPSEALKPCRWCKKRIAPTATKCPECGIDQGIKSKKLDTTRWIIWSVIGVGVLMLMQVAAGVSYGSSSLIQIGGPVVLVLLIIALVKFLRS